MVASLNAPALVLGKSRPWITVARQQRQSFIRQRDPMWPTTFHAFRGDVPNGRFKVDLGEGREPCLATTCGS